MRIYVQTELKIGEIVKKLYTHIYAYTLRSFNESLRFFCTFYKLVFTYTYNSINNLISKLIWFSHNERGIIPAKIY